MIIQDLVDLVYKLPDNLERGMGMYVSAPNMAYFADQLKKIDARQGILITPYLIVRGGAIYELHYYEFDVEVRGTKSCFADYGEKNTLPEEITHNLKPRAIVAVGDTKFYHEAVMTYLSKMRAMSFKDDKEHYPQLQGAQLFYQIFIDPDV